MMGYDMPMGIQCNDDNGYTVYNIYQTDQHHKITI